MTYSPHILVALIIIAVLGLAAHAYMSHFAVWIKNTKGGTLATVILFFLFLAGAVIL